MGIGGLPEIAPDVSPARVRWTTRGGRGRDSSPWHCTGSMDRGYVIDRSWRQQTTGFRRAVFLRPRGSARRHSHQAALGASPATGSCGIVRLATER